MIKNFCLLVLLALGVFSNYSFSQTTNPILSIDENLVREDAIKFGIPEDQIEDYIKAMKREYDSHSHPKPMTNRSNARAAAAEEKLDFTPTIINNSCELVGFEGLVFGNQTFLRGSFTGDNNGVKIGWEGRLFCHPLFKCFGCQTNLCPKNKINKIDNLRQRTVERGFDEIINQNIPRLPTVDGSGGRYSAKLGNSNINGEAEELIYTFKYDPQNPIFTYNVAVVLQVPHNIPHTKEEMPYFSAVAYDQNGNKILCSDYTVSADVGDMPNFHKIKGNEVDIAYRPWTKNIIDLRKHFKGVDPVGKFVTVVFTTMDCSLGAHYGYAYIDAECGKAELETKNELCLNSPIQFINPLAKNYPGETYSWDFGDGSELSTDERPCHEFKTGGRFTVQSTITINSDLRPEKECKVVIMDKSIILASECKPEPIDIELSGGLCTGSSIQFSTKDVPNSKYKWDFGDGKVIEGPRVVNHTYNIATKYKVTLTRITKAEGGCESTKTAEKEITISSPVQIEKPTINYQGELCAQERIYFNITPFNYNANVKWEYGDGNTGTGSYNCHDYSSPGEYIVKVTLTPFESNCSAGPVVVEKPISIKNCPPPEIVYDPNCVNKPVNFSLNPPVINSTYAWNFGDGNTSTEESPTHTYNAVKDYEVTATITKHSANACNSKRVMTSATTVKIISCCEECLPTFSPEPGKEYILSAWVREDQLNFIENYAKAAVKVNFKNVDGSIDETSIAEMKAKGTFVDGWQRIEEKFLVPAGSKGIIIELKSNPDVDVYYDDLRVHPVDASMRSFVYDPESMRLMSILDENNYASYYEYDQEGKLIRVKKETERGVMSVQESFNNTFKKKE